MRIFILLFLLTVFTNINSQSANPFLNLKFDKVMMYDFEGGKDADLYIISDSGKLAKSVTKAVQLKKAQVNTLSTKLGSKQAYGGSTAACFDPHLGFVYYLNG